MTEAESFYEFVIQSFFKKELKMISKQLRNTFLYVLVSALCLIALTGCSGQTGKRAGQGAAAAAGAVGGVVSA